MMRTHHPQCWVQVPGDQRRYWACSSRDGRLGGPNCCAASWRQQVRDAFIGWSAAPRVANLGQVLIIPGGCGFTVWPRSCWRTRRWSGAGGVCYRSAGGRCSAPMRHIHPTRVLHTNEGTDWVNVEYGRSRHPDGRLCERTARIGRTWRERPRGREPIAGLCADTGGDDGRSSGGDVWGLLDQARSQPADVLVRVRRGSRGVRVEGAKRPCLWAHLETLPQVHDRWNRGTAPERFQTRRPPTLPEAMNALNLR